MFRSTEQEANKLKDWLENNNPGTSFVLQVGLGGIGFNVYADRVCKSCGQQVLQGNGWDKPAQCADCASNATLQLNKMVDRQIEEARSRQLQSEDFEQVQQ